MKIEGNISIIGGKPPWIPAWAGTTSKPDSRHSSESRQTAGWNPAPAGRRESPIYWDDTWCLKLANCYTGVCTWVQ